MSAVDYLTIIMESDPSVRLIKSLDEATSQAFEEDWVQLKDTGDSDVLERILQFYSRHGMDLMPPNSQTIPFVKRMKEESKFDDTPILSEQEAAELEEDPVLFAQKAARDSSLSMYEACFLVPSPANDSSQTASDSPRSLPMHLTS